MNELLETCKNKYELVAKLVEQFPDLKETKDDYGRNPRFSAESVKDKVMDLEFGRTCGCCSDAGWTIKPFLEYEGIKIYHEPYGTVIGWGVDVWVGEGVNPKSDWKETVKDYPKIIEEKIQEFFDKNPPRREEDEE